MREEKLNELKNMIPIMRDIAGGDPAISIWNNEGTILYYSAPSTYKLPFYEGFVLEDKTDKLYTVLREGKTLYSTIPKEVFGVEIEGNIIPVKDEGKIVGCITCVTSNAKYEQLKEEVDKMHDTLHESSDFIKAILTASMKSAENFKSAEAAIQSLKDSVNAVNNVTDAIKGNTSRTKMLALNASIEATRAGESGKGFAVVANEMGKLSQMSSESVTNINATLGEMNDAIARVTAAMEKINDASFKNSGEIEKVLNQLDNIAN